MFIFSYKNVTISCRGYISKTGLCWGRKSWLTNHDCKRLVLGVLSSECLLTPSKVFMIYDQRFGDQSGVKYGCLAEWAEERAYWFYSQSLSHCSVFSTVLSTMMYRETEGSNFHSCPPGIPHLVGNVQRVESSRWYQEKCPESDRGKWYAVYRNTERDTLI